MKVLIADDHEIIRKGLAQILHEYSPVAEIEEAVDGEDALIKAGGNTYDLIVLDISMPGKTGLEVLSELSERNQKSKVLILSIHPGKEYALRAFKLGASGYISKDKAADELIKAIDFISRGRKYISGEIAEQLLDLQTDQTSLAPHELLSEQEYKVFYRLVNGKRIGDIANELYLSPKTISTYKKRVLEKMKMEGISELTKYAVEHNLAN